MRLAVPNYGVKNMIGHRRLDYEIALTECHLALLNGDRELAIDNLRQGMEIAKECGDGSSLCAYPDFLPMIFGLALDEGIEVELVQKMIRAYKLQPKELPLHLENWPYPIKIYTLGRFSILKNDTALSFTGKAQKNPWIC